MDRVAEQTSRSPIRQLAPGLVNRIAAGEVIERPASVVKELVENSIDAGATAVTVEIADGGRELIRIVDDGCGIPPAELPLAFAAHATSKLTCDDDLFAIRTMGFRGEALASIGSVSHARILSRTADGGEYAYEILNRGGDISDPQQAAGNRGTTIEIRNLFYNVPARRKFLKGAQTEYGHIYDTVVRLALPHPHVAFRLISNGRTALDFPAEDAERRWLRAWPAEFAEQRLPLTSRDAEIRLRGLVGLPELAGPTAKHQHLYVNGRPIRDKFVQHALREAFRGLTEPGRHPAAILLIELPPADVDVNVHPTKAEVRFKDGGRIHGLVMAVVREALLGSDLTPRAQPRGGIGASSSTAGPARESMHQQLADFFKAGPVNPANWASTFHQPQPATTQMHLPVPSDAREASPSPPLPKGEGWGEGGTPSHGGVPYERAVGGPDGSNAAEVREPPHPNPLPTGEGTGGAAPVAVPSSAADPARAALNAIQLHNSYLVAETDDGLVIIDQHALHERIMFEELLARVTRGPLESQRLLIPVTFAASAKQVALLEELAPTLERLGVEVFPFGPDTLAVQAFPSFLEKLDPAGFVRELLEKAEQNQLDLTQESLLHEVLDMMSCKAAVKAGDPLTPQEIDALLAQRHLVDRASNCPHGRPTTLRLSLKDLEKQFKRTGF
jgi:DNA mismatch repair protein MutL